MSARLPRWIHGHRWGAWKHGYANVLGWRFKVRWCGQCGARDSRQVG